MTEAEVIRGSRIVIAGLMGGLVMFVVISFIAGPLDAGSTVNNALLGVGALAAFFGAAVYLSARRSLLALLAREFPASRLQSELPDTILVAYRRFVVLGGGAIEGPAYLFALLHLLSGSGLALGMVGFAMLLLSLHFPSSDRLRRLLEKAGEP